MNKMQPLSQVRIINGLEIVNFITDFRPQPGGLRYRIWLHLHGGETIVFAEYRQYEAYRQAWGRLHAAKREAGDLRIRR